MLKLSGANVPLYPLFVVRFLFVSTIVAPFLALKMPPGCTLLIEERNLVGLVDNLEFPFLSSSANCWSINFEFLLLWSYDLMLFGTSVT